MKMEVTDPKTGIIYRDSTFDIWILNESRGYFPLGIRKEDVILDLGGHIGTFASRAMIEMKVPLLSIEAEKSNYDILCKNASYFGFNQIHAAVVPDEFNGNTIT